MNQKDDTHTRTHTKMEILNHTISKFVRQSLEFIVDSIFVVTGFTRVLPEVVSSVDSTSSGFIFFGQEHHFHGRKIKKSC